MTQKEIGEILNISRQSVNAILNSNADHKINEGFNIDPFILVKKYSKLVEAKNGIKLYFTYDEERYIYNYFERYRYYENRVLIHKDSISTMF